MSPRLKPAITIIAVLAVLAWSPWITDEYAKARVVESLGGPDATFRYLGEEMKVQDVPIVVAWAPFARYVVFPSEAGWFVTFYGAIV